MCVRYVGIALIALFSFVSHYFHETLKKPMKLPYMVTVSLSSLMGIKSIHDINPLFILSGCCVLKKHRFFLVYKVLSIDELFIPAELL